jgi:hypothetical protein
MPTMGMHVIVFLPLRRPCGSSNWAAASSKQQHVGDDPHAVVGDDPSPALTNATVL